jgi:hypothetical protein
MKSVTVALQGGLGNQMFQYALGRTLSLRLGLPLTLDLAMLRIRTATQPPRRYELGRFRLAGPRLRDRPLWLARAGDSAARWLASRGIGSMCFVNEASLAFQPEALQVSGPCRLEGYWQSERYFEAMATELREDFTFQQAPDAHSAGYESRLRAVKSVGLNFRRTDFVESPFHGTCSENYYTAALERVVERLGRDIELFIFSDDMEWCRKNVRYSLPTTYVDWEGMDHTSEDLRLMSACRALVMANSTFSWWAGWLNPRPDKLIIAPRQWFQAPGYISDLPNSPWLTAL